MNASTDWQSWAAILVVAGTGALFLKRMFWKKKKKTGGGGCSSCGTGSSKPVAGSRTQGR